MTQAIRFATQFFLAIAACTVFLTLQGSASDTESPPSTPAIEPLPQGIASFGATRLGDWVYVYSGHTGKTHTYSKDDMLKGFYRVSVTKGGAWESLPFTSPGQAVSLINDGKLVYRIGGMQARNERGADKDLYSLSEVASFDPDKQEWVALPDLPAPRSSHRAAILENKLYVLGGWSIKGGESGDWLKDGLVLDLTNTKEGWKSVPQPAERRALDVVAARGKIWMIGGLTPHDEVSDEVHCYDPASQQWSKGPTLPGPVPIGNGIAAIAEGDELFLGGMDGKIYRLNADANQWSECGKLPSGRIHHRLVALDKMSLLTIGGSSRSRHIATTEIVKVER
jgi:N-acetylneuraminic acid mutarotase